MDKLKLSQVKTTINLKTEEINVFYSLKSALDRNIDYDVYLPSKKMNLQRDFCWTLRQKQQLIMSIFKGITIPKLAIIQIDDHTDKNKVIYQIIDGKQRLSAMLGFIRGEFPISVNDVDYYFEDLDYDCQGTIIRFSPRCDLGYAHSTFDNVTDDDKIAWFEQINFSGTAQDEDHMKLLKQK